MDRGTERRWTGLMPGMTQVKAVRARRRSSRLQHLVPGLGRQDAGDSLDIAFSLL